MVSVTDHYCIRPHIRSGYCGYSMDLSKYPTREHRLEFVRVYLASLDPQHVTGVLSTLGVDCSVLTNEEFIEGFQVHI